MGTVQRIRNIPGFDRALEAFVTAIELTTSSIWSFSIVLGIALVFIGAVLLEETWAGLFGIWGATTIFVGISGYAFIAWLRARYGDR